MRVYCGIDIGGTSVRIILINTARQILAKNQFSTLPGSGPDAFMEKLTASIHKILHRSGSDFGLQSIGIGCTGPVDENTGVILNPYTLGGLEGFGLTEAIYACFQVPVYLDNDANTAHLGEIAAMGDAAPQNSAILTMGTGVGVSIRVGGEIFRVPGGIHPEIGHIPAGIISDVTCYCGKRDCLENTLSGTAINRDSYRLFGLSPEAVLDCCDTPEKQKFRENLITALANSIAILTGIFNCDLVFIVGGMQPFFEKYLIEETRNRLKGLENIFGGTNILSKEASSISGSFGAAILAQDKFERNAQ